MPFRCLCHREKSLKLSKINTSSTKAPLHWVPLGCSNPFPAESLQIIWTSHHIPVTHVWSKPAFKRLTAFTVHLVFHLPAARPVIYSGAESREVLLNRRRSVGEASGRVFNIGPDNPTCEPLHQTQERTIGGGWWLVVSTKNGTAWVENWV